MADLDHTHFVVFVDDPTQGLKNYEVIADTASAEDAQTTVQEAFPYGIIRAVVSNAELEEGDTERARATRKRVEEDGRLKQVWGRAFDVLGGANTLR